MIFHIRKGETLQQSNSDTIVPWDMMPNLSKLGSDEQIVVSLCCDTDRNVVKGMSDSDKAITIAAYLHPLTAKEVTKMMEAIKVDGSDLNKAAKEYWRCQKKPLHLALEAIDKKIEDFSMQLMVLEIQIKEDSSDKQFDRALNLMVKFEDLSDSREALLKRIGGANEEQFTQLFLGSKKTGKGMLNEMRDA